ncbi:uncharacterized protein LOC119288924 [Triticum dicoccoides]|uniref:uncharacterized protein LOC119288924 n=1 Tax=Triticum dicoccoides TaxID=85692 RepID=UPI00188F6B53|nr:uncharacterized protein LOC119288924 [Triticum dicoccoides]
MTIDQDIALTCAPSSLFLPSPSSSALIPLSLLLLLPQGPEDLCPDAMDGGRRSLIPASCGLAKPQAAPDLEGITAAAPSSRPPRASPAPFLSKAAVVALVRRDQFACIASVATPTSPHCSVCTAHSRRLPPPPLPRIWPVPMAPRPAKSSVASLLRAIASPMSRRGRKHTAPVDRNAQPELPGSIRSPLTASVGWVLAVPSPAAFPPTNWPSPCSSR